MKNLAEHLQLYVVTDERPDVYALLDVVREAIRGGATAVQLRRKYDDGHKLVEIGHAIRRITQEMDALYIVNDRVDVALLTNADGVHVGQSDISCSDVRALVGGKIIGVSASNVREAVAAVRDGADYLGVGAIYPTTSKLDADMCGFTELSEIAHITDVPIVAIGGITKENATEVLEYGAHGVAVVSAVMSAEHPEHAASELRRLITECRAVHGDSDSR